MYDCDVCIVGAGSAGIGAAVRAAESGASVILIEKNQRIGGTAVNAWINGWEPSAGGSGLAKTIWQTMLPHHPNPLVPYESTLRGAPPEVRWSLPFPVDLYVWAVEKLFGQHPNLRVLTDTPFVAAQVAGTRVRHIVVVRDGQQHRITARVFIDSSADGNLCVAAGCQWRLGEDAQSDFNEPHAPQTPQRRLNALDLIYAVQYTGEEVPFELPDDVEPGLLDKDAHVLECPPGYRTINTCGSMAGIRWIDEDRGALLAEARRRALSHFDYFRRCDPWYRRCRFMGTAPQIGVRETRRIVCEYTLTEHDVMTGYDRQDHADMVAICDHPLDVHGQGHLHQWLDRPYGVPYRCLIPKGLENLLAAGRCAGFSHIAGSTCRLSRTMMALGEAAGLAANLMVSRNLGALEVPFSELLAKLIIDDRPDFVPLPRL